MGTTCFVVVTHQHNDHINYLKELKQMTADVSKDVSNRITLETILVGGEASKTTDGVFSLYTNAMFCEVCAGGGLTNMNGDTIYLPPTKEDDAERPRTLHKDIIKDCLGPGVTVELLLPATSAGRGDHEQRTSF